MPFRSSPFGTGQPSYVSEQAARDVIKKVFREAGYHLEEGVKYEKDDISFMTSGFDEKAKVGYIWGDWKTLDHADAIINWSTPRLDKNEIQQILELEKEDPNDCDLMLQHIGGRITDMDPKGQHADDIKAALAMETARETIDALSPILEKLKSQENDDRISLREMKKLENEIPKNREFVAVINQFDTRFASNAWSKEFIEERMEAAKIKDRDKRNAALKALAEKEAITGLQALEEAVSDYLSWARSQGLQ